VKSDLGVPGAMKSSVDAVHRWALRNADDPDRQEELTLASAMASSCLSFRIRELENADAEEADDGDDGGYGFYIPSKEATAAIVNPYLLSLRQGMDFEKVCRVARLMDFDNDSPAGKHIQAVAAAVYHLKANQRDGHTYLPAQELASKLRQSLGRRVDIHGLTFPVSMTDGEEEEKTQYVLVFKDKVCLPETFRREKGLAEIILMKLRQPDRPFDAALAERCFKDVMGGKAPTDGQRAAMRMAITKWVCIITGGPGTGKSTVTAAITKYFENKPLCVHLCAPTGKAAQRLRIASGRKARTIHSLLNCPKWVSRTVDDLSSSQGHGGECTDDLEHCMKERKKGDDEDLSYSLERDHAVLADEWSMAELTLAHRLFESFPQNASDALIGDPDQLPSIGCGNVLGDMLSCPAIPRVVLNETLRQTGDETAGILAVAADIREQKLRVPLPYEAPGCQVHIIAGPEDFAGVATRISDLFRDELAKRRGAWEFTQKDMQILVPKWDGRAGIHEINRRIQLLNPRYPDSLRFETEKDIPSGDDGKSEKELLYEGDKVICKRNNHKRNVYNGSTGIVRRVNLDLRTGDPASVTIHWFDEGRDETYQKDDPYILHHIHLAYAVSVHAAQGSEYPTVILASCAEYGKLLQTRKLLYTGVTRAKTNVHIVCQPAELEAGVRRADRPRRTLLGEFLRAGSAD
jgi:exodeoxyribonuclease V alpha subunit